MSYKVGVDVGGTNVRVALGNDKGKIASRLNERSDKLSDSAGISHQIIRMIRLIAPVSRIHSIGVGSAGPLNLKDGSIVHSPQFGFGRIPLVKPLEKEFRVPVYLVNDCQAAVVAEKELGQGKKYANLVYVTISSGIGAGVFVDNHLLIGKDGNAHEVGHVIIDCAGKLRCGCGRRGHWEAYCGGASASSFIRFQLESKSCVEIKRSLLYKTSRGNLNKLSSEDLMESARRTCLGDCGGDEKA